MPLITDDFQTKITLETEANALPDDMPFHLLLIGDWSGQNRLLKSSRKKPNDYSPVEIDRDNFDEVMRKLGVELLLNLEDDGNNFLHLRFREIDDFHPDKIFEQVPLFSELRKTRKQLLNPQTFDEAARTIRLWTNQSEEELSEDKILDSQDENSSPMAENLLDQILSQPGKSAASEQSQTTSSSELNILLEKLVRPHLIQIDEKEQSQFIDAVDNATGELMRKILHHPQFQALEAAWRSANLLVSRIETDASLKLFLLDITKEELANDLKSVENLTDSAFYKLLVEKTRRNSSQESWSAICANFAFKPDVDDIAILMRVAEIARDANAPFITQADSEILGVESLANTSDARHWSLPSDSPAAKLWSMLRALREASYLGLAIPRLMMRLPYGAKTEPIETFSFEELTTATGSENYLWANPSFACALLLAQSFTLYGWEMKGRLLQDVEDLPMHIYKSEGETIIKPCAELFMTLKMAEKILEAGLMPLLSFRDSNRVRIAGFQSITLPSTPLNGKWVA